MAAAPQPHRFDPRPAPGAGAGSPPDARLPVQTSGQPASMFPAPRDVFREKAEREAQKRSKSTMAAPAPKAEPAPAPTRPKLAAAPPPPPRPVVLTPVSMAAPRPRPVILAADPEPAPPPPKSDAKSAAAAYYGLSDGDGGKPKGGGGDDPPVDRDVVMGATIIILVLLLLAWLFMGREAPKQEEAMLQPAMAPVAPAAAPKPDALPPGPLDLRPSETPAPEPTPDATLAVAAAPTPEPTPTPTTPACPRGRMVNVFFCTASAELTPSMRSEVEKELANWGQCLASEKIVVTGYADTRGASEYNVALATSRAEAAASLLAAAGLTVVAKSGVGELDGLEDNQNCANQRRVDVTVQSSEYGPPSRSCAPPTEQKKLVCG